MGKMDRPSSDQLSSTAALRQEVSTVLFELYIGIDLLTKLGQVSPKYECVTEVGLHVEWVAKRCLDLRESVESLFDDYVTETEAQS
jgi:hypothetical protein